MLVYTKIQPRFSPKAFLVMQKKIFKCFLPYMGMAAILFDVEEPFEQIAKPFWQMAPYEIWWNLLKQFKKRRDLKITQFYRCKLPRGKGR